MSDHPSSKSSNDSKILPVYLYILDEYLIWANDLSLQPLLLYEVKRLILDNLEEIEIKAKVDPSNKLGLVRLTSSEHLLLVYGIKRLGGVSNNNNLIRIEFNHSGSDQATALKHASFGLSIWIYPIEMLQEGKSLPTDEVTGEI